MRTQATLNETELMFGLAASNLRIDGRMPDEKRPVTISLIDNGNCLFTLGHTRVHVETRFSITVPTANKPKSGRIKVYLKTIDERRIDQTVRDIVHSLFSERGVVDVESLCIVPSVACWFLSVDACVLNDAGNVTDAIVSAIDSETGLYHVYSTSERIPVPISMFSVPISTTYGCIGPIETSPKDDKCFLVYDPLLIEETDRVTVVTATSGHILAVSKSGGSFLKSPEVNLLTEKSFGISSVLWHEISESVQS